MEKARVEDKDWYISCEFISKEMQFYCYNDFVSQCIVLKRLYKKQDFRTKKLYKWYVYASFMKYSQKCLVWEYLNDDATYKELLSRLDKPTSSLEQRNLYNNYKK